MWLPYVTFSRLQWAYRKYEQATFLICFRRRRRPSSWVDGETSMSKTIKI